MSLSIGFFLLVVGPSPLGIGLFSCLLNLAVCIVGTFLRFYATSFLLQGLVHGFLSPFLSLIGHLDLLGELALKLVRALTHCLCALSLLGELESELATLNLFLRQTRQQSLIRQSQTAAAGAAFKCTFLFLDPAVLARSSSPLRVHGNRPPA